MSEVLASLKKIGGNGEQYTETVLWTNPSPTANFAAQNVTLSESMGNYKYIGIRFAYDTSYKTGEYISTLLETVADFRKYGNGTGVRRNGSAICISDANNKSYERLCIYVSDTSVRFNPCYQVASSTQANNNAVPFEILGINELAHGKKLPETVLWTNPNPNTNFDAQSVTLSDNISNYDFICVEFDGLSDRPTPRYINRVVFYVEDFKTYAYAGGTTHRVGLTGFQIDTSNYSYARFVYYVDDTHVGFSTGYSINRVANTTAVTPPIRIIGIKVG